MKASRRPGALPEVVGRKRIHTVRCAKGGEALVHIYAAPNGNIIELRCPTQYAGTPSASLLDEADGRLPDHYWVLLREWDGPRLPTMECHGAIRDVNWDAVASMQVTTL